MRLWAKAIEAKRKKMSLYVTKEGISAKKTIQCSQELDKLLLPYETINSGSLLGIREKFDGITYTICLSGDLDYFSIDQLLHLFEGLEKHSVHNIIIDLTQLRFIDSIGYEIIHQAMLFFCPKGISINIIGIKDQQKIRLYVDTLHYVMA